MESDGLCGFLEHQQITTVMAQVALEPSGVGRVELAGLTAHECDPCANQLLLYTRI